MRRPPWIAHKLYFSILNRRILPEEHKMLVEELQRGPQAMPKLIWALLNTLGIYLYQITEEGMKDFALTLNELERRDFLAGVAKAALGVSILPPLAGAALEPGGHVKPKNPKARNVIFLYMNGGMSHLDTFDPKTNSEVKGISSPIKTNAPGLQISNHLPSLAKHGDKLPYLGPWLRRRAHTLKVST